MAALALAVVLGGGAMTERAWAAGGIAALQNRDSATVGFAIPQPGAPLPFPATHGSHPDFKIEWWYLTGHLRTAKGTTDGARRFGFQATFFRFAERPPGAPAPATPQPGIDENTLHMAHMAISDIDGGQFHFEERLTREGWDAFARVGALDLRNGNWSLRMTDPESEAMHLKFSVDGRAQADFQLLPTKPRVRFGEDGTSRKGPDPDARSYYISFTRLQVNGTLQIDGAPMAVEGQAWMDHEIASNQLSDDLVGWDWTAIQFNDGSEVKAYLLRQRDGTPSPFSAFIHIAVDGTVRYFGADDFRWEEERVWTSPTTGTRYPIGVRIVPPPHAGLPFGTLRLVPLLDNQEIDGAVGDTPYWEGACAVEDEAGRRIGAAYLELVIAAQ